MSLNIQEIPGLSPSVSFNLTFFMVIPSHFKEESGWMDGWMDGKQKQQAVPKNMKDVKKVNSHYKITHSLLSP